MPVKIISHSQDREKSLEELVCYCARVSNPSNQSNTSTNGKLIAYLMKHKHWSPFEMVSICLEIETTRDIARQIMRHRSFSFQEFSQRYAVAENYEIREARMQDTKNRQNSIETNNYELSLEWTNMQKELADHAFTVYHWALEKGIAKEQARVVLPEGMTQSRIYMNGTLRSWIHYIQLRTTDGTQKEHRTIALECAEAISDVFPSIYDCVNNSNI